jgi:hypothetical protein
MTYDMEVVHAYGGVHFTMPFYDAVDQALFSMKEGSALMVVRVSEDAFELLDFNPTSRMDSEYVSVDVGRRLVSEGLVDVMVTWHDPEDGPTSEEDFEARRRAQVYGDYVP